MQSLYIYKGKIWTSISPNFAMAAPEISYYLPFFLGLITAVRSFVRTFFKYRSQIEAPPSPPSLPLIGHLNLLGPVLPKPSQPIWSTHADTFRDTRVLLLLMLLWQKKYSRPMGAKFHLSTWIWLNILFIEDRGLWLPNMVIIGGSWRNCAWLESFRSVPQLDKFSTDIREEERVKLFESVTTIVLEKGGCVTWIERSQLSQTFRQYYLRDGNEHRVFW